MLIRKFHWRRPLQLRLATLLIVMTVCCLGMTYRRSFITRFDRQAQAAKQIKAWGGSVEFETARPAWFAPIVGRERYRDVVMVNLEHRRIRDKQLTVLRDLPRVRKLYLASNPITSNGLKEIANLQYVERLSLWNTSISDRGMHEIAQLQNLKALDIQNTKITDVGLHHLVGHPHLRELLLGDGISGGGLKSVGTIRQLKLLSVSNRLDVSAFEDLGACGIEQIQHWRWMIQGKDLHYFRNLKRLHTLPSVVINCSDEHLDSLRELTELQALQVTGDLSDRAIATLCKLPSLRWLSITGHITPAGIMHFEDSKIANAIITTPYVNHSNAAILRNYQGTVNVQVETPWLLPNETRQYEPAGNIGLRLVSRSSVSKSNSSGQPLEIQLTGLTFGIDPDWKQLLDWPTITSVDLMSFSELPIDVLEQMPNLRQVFFVGTGCTGSDLERLCKLKHLQVAGIISSSFPGIPYDLFDGNSLVNFQNGSMQIVVNRSGGAIAPPQASTRPSIPSMMPSKAGGAYHWLERQGILNLSDVLMMQQGSPGLAILNATPDSDLMRLKDAKQIRVLELVGCLLSDEQWKLVWQMPKLEHLSMQLCALRSAAGGLGLDGIENLTTLKSLEIGGQGPQIIISGRPGSMFTGPSMSSVYDYANLVNEGDEALAPIGRLKNLEELTIHLRSFEGQALHEFSRLTNLRILDLSLSGLSDRHFAELPPLPNLDRLNLSGTLVTDAIVDELSRFPKLRECQIVGSHMSPSGKARLDELLDQRTE